MKIKSAAIAALLSTSLISSPTFATATFDDAAPAGIDNADAQAVCDTLASNHGGTAPLVYHGTLEQGSISGEIVTGPTANGDPSAPTNVQPGDGAVQVPESVQVVTDPYRIGGSVNMFGMARVVAAHWDFSQYDFTQAFVWTSNYSFTCNMTETVPTPALGVHEWVGPANASQQAKDECADTVAHPYDDRGAACAWRETIPAGTDEEDRDPETGYILGVNEGGTLNGHEDHGGPIPVNEGEVDSPDVQVVVCISPIKKAGTWTKKNGYTGDKCTTTWYNTGAITSSPYTNINSSSNNIVTIP